MSIAERLGEASGGHALVPGIAGGPRHGRDPLRIFTPPQSPGDSLAARMRPSVREFVRGPTEECRLARHACVLQACTLARDGVRAFGGSIRDEAQ